jgi:histidinol-phosphate phosphatase family protein|tara:strand:- start:120 stop:683 length:564 start_codon:yes stop_codon:yes gene_type:complete
MKILLMDRDGTINRSPGLGRYVESWEVFEFREDTVEAMKVLADDGYSFIVITNQAGIASGIVEAEEVDRIHRNMRRSLADLGICVLEVYLCSDPPGIGSMMRKPGPGMFEEAARDHGFRLGSVLYVGDDPRDCEAAVNAGCGMVLLGNELEFKNLPMNPVHSSVSRSLGRALKDVHRFYSKVSDGVR